LNKTKGQVEDTISKEFVKFYVKTLGVGPKESKVYILEDMVIVRVKGELLPFEEVLLHGRGGIELVKRIRKTIHETTIAALSDIIHRLTGATVVSFHSDTSTKTGERFEIFILDGNLEERFTNR
jgi:uncharacterized protein YbcI